MKFILHKAPKKFSEVFISRGFQVALFVKNPPANIGDFRDMGSIPGSGRYPEGGHSNPLQYACLENPHEQRSLEGCSP